MLTNKIKFQEFSKLKNCMLSIHRIDNLSDMTKENYNESTKDDMVIKVEERENKIKQELESGWFQWSELSLPASLTIQSGINNPRYASLRGIMMAKNKPLESIEVNLSDYESSVELERLYIPSKTKETQYIDGSTDEMATEILNILTTEIKVL